MSYIPIFYLFISSFGLIVYIRIPKLFFVYWLSVPAFVVPLFFILFNPSYVGKQTIETFYMGFRAPLVYLLIFITIVEYLKTRRLRQKGYILPFFVLTFFLIAQNVLKGFNAEALLVNVREVLFLMMPTIALSISPRLRPKRKELINFLFLFIAIEAFFCILNSVGFRLYSKYSSGGSFADVFLCGTFLRYNHLTNYLTTFYLFLSTAYFTNRSIPRSGYIIVTIIVGFIIIMSGARISVILFFLTIGLFFLLYRSKYVVLLVIIAIVFAYAAPIMLSKFDVGTPNADQATGFERNITGLMDLFKSKNVDENTLTLSAFLLLTKFGDPLMGNGYAYRNTNQYEISGNIDEITLQTDSRVAFMMVDYGIVGCLCFAFFFYGIIKCNRNRYGNKSRRLWTILILYYIAFTITETGIFDLVPFSMLSIYCFSRVGINIPSLFIMLKKLRYEILYRLLIFWIADHRLIVKYLHSVELKR